MTNTLSILIMIFTMHMTGHGAQKFVESTDCRFTQSEDGKRLYLHLLANPFAHVILKSLGGKVDYAQFLHDGSEVRFTDGKVDHFSEGRPEGDDLLTLYIPSVKPHILVPVIEMFLK